MILHWKSISDEIPEVGDTGYFISGHEWIGIGIWNKDKGFIEAFTGDFPCGGYDLHKDSRWINESVMWWAEIPDYEKYVYGKCGYESALMQRYIKKEEV